MSAAGAAGLRRTVWLIRHPAPAIAPQTCYGQLDIGLREPPEQGARRLLLELPPLGAVFSSPLRRCQGLAACLHSSPILDPRLMEISFGEWEGRGWDEIGRRALDAWAADPLGHTPPGGESARSMAERVVSFAADLPQWLGAGAPAGDIAVVAHQGPLRVLAAHWQGESESAWLTRDFAFGAAVSLKVHF